MGIEAGISGYAQGDLLKMFLTRASKFGYVIAVLDSSPIKTLADVKGKIIGVHIPSTAMSATLGGPAGFGGPEAGGL